MAAPKKAKAPIIADNPKPSVRAELIAFAHMYRGGDDSMRGNANACYRVLHPKAAASTVKGKAYAYLNHPIVQEILAQKAQELSEKADITQERVLKEVVRIGLFDPRRLFSSAGQPIPIQELDDDTAAAIAGIKVREVPFGEDGRLATITEYKLASKNDALEKLMKHLGLYEQDNKQKNESLAEALVAGINRVKGLQ